MIDTKMVAGLGAVVMLALGNTGVSANEAHDVESARANARAGGPTNALDAWYLERYGCLSGTRSAFCEKLSYRDKAKYRVVRKRDRH